MRISVQDQNANRQETDHAVSAGHRTEHDYTGARNRNKLQQMWGKRTLCKSVQTKVYQQPNSEKLTEEETNDRDKISRE